MHAFFYKQRQAGKIGRKIKQKLSNTLRLNFCYLKFIRFLHPRYHLNLRSSCRNSSGRVQKYWFMSFVCIHVLIFYWWINNSWTVYHTLGKVLELSVLFIKGDFFPSASRVALLWRVKVAGGRVNFTFLVGARSDIRTW